MTQSLKIAGFLPFLRGRPTQRSVLVQGFTLPKRVLTSLLGVLSSYLRAQVGFDSCFYLDHDADEPVEQLEEGVKENMHILKEAGLDELADGVRAFFVSLSFFSLCLPALSVSCSCLCVHLVSLSRVGFVRVFRLFSIYVLVVSKSVDTIS